MRKHERKNMVYVGFMDLEKAYGRVNSEKCMILVVNVSCPPGSSMYI